MSVALVLPSYEPFEPASGALSIIVRQLALELAARGYPATVVGPAPQSPWDHGVSADLVPAPSTVQRGFDRLSRIRDHDRVPTRYRRQVAERCHGLDHIVVMNDVELAVAVDGSSNAPTMVFAQNEIEPGRAAPDRVRALDGMLACSPYIQGWLTKRYGAAAGWVHLVANGVDLDQFEGVERPDCAGATGVFVGRIDPNKGIMELLEATTEAHRRGVELRLRIAGPIAPWGLEPSEHPAFARRFQEAVARADAEYLGALDRSAIAAMMGAADILFVPSVSQEPFGLVAVESLASGGAVVVSDRGALPWIAGDAALVVEPTAMGLLDAIERLVADPPLRLDLSRRGRERALEFGWSRSADQLLGALSGSPRP
jgi:glycosyltransferase involved in cell wall biosynthesis